MATAALAGGNSASRACPWPLSGRSPDRVGPAAPARRCTNVAPPTRDASASLIPIGPCLPGLPCGQEPCPGPGRPDPGAADTGTTQDVRFAVAISGGVSLAVWMGGVAREINLLQQASRSLQRDPGPVPDQAARPAPAGRTAPPPLRPEARPGTGQGRPPGAGQPLRELGYAGTQPVPGAAGLPRYHRHGGRTAGTSAARSTPHSSGCPAQPGRPGHAA